MAESRLNSYRDLDVWRRSIALAENCYRRTAAFLRDENYGMTSQIRRACVPIPANIAEGYGCEQAGSYIRFARIAQGSARELGTHIMLTQRIGLPDQECAAELMSACERVSKMLRALIRALEAKLKNRRRTCPHIPIFRSTPTTPDSPLPTPAVLTSGAPQ